MSGTRQHRKRRHTFVGDLAPHVDPKWAEAFMLELRLRGVHGDDIGAALAEIDSHCAEAEVTAEEAFGPAKDYAVSLDLPADTAQHTGEIVKAVLPSVFQLLGMMLMIWSAPVLGTGGLAEVTLGGVVLVLLVAASILLLAWKSGALMRFIMENRVLFILACGAFFASLMLSMLLLREPRAELPPLALLITGIVVLLSATVTAFLRSRNGQGLGDVVAAPLEDHAEVARRRRTLQRVDYVRIFMMPVLAAALTTVLAFFGAIS